MFQWLRPKAPEAVEQKSLTFPEQWEAALLGALPTPFTSIVVTPTNAMRSTAARRAVQAIAEPVGQLPLHVFKRNGQDRERDREHPVAKVLADPNEFTSSQDFREQLQRDALLHGNGLAVIVRVDDQPAELIRLDPAQIDIIRNDAGEPEYRTRSTPTRIYAARDVFHIKAPSLVGLKGLSIVNDCREAIALALVLEEHGNRLFGSGARPSGVISTQKPLGDEGVKRMIAGWKAAHEGPGKSGKSAILWDGATWTPEAFSSVDAQFLELRRYAVDEIARAFGVPPHLLFEMGRATWGNAAELGSSFVTFTLMRWLKAWQGEIRLKLIEPDERDTLYAEFLVDDLLKADISARATAYAQLITARVMNPNEARARENLAPYEGGDEFANPNTTTQGSPQSGGAAEGVHNLHTPDEDDPDAA